MIGPRFKLASSSSEYTLRLNMLGEYDLVTGAANDGKLFSEPVEVFSSDVGGAICGLGGSEFISAESVELDSSLFTESEDKEILERAFVIMESRSAGGRSVRGERGGDDKGDRGGELALRGETEGDREGERGGEMGGDFPIMGEEGGEVRFGEPGIKVLPLLLVLLLLFGDRERAVDLRGRENMGDKFGFEFDLVGVNSRFILVGVLTFRQLPSSKAH